MEISTHWASILTSLSNKMDYLDFFMDWEEIKSTMIFTDEHISMSEKEYIAQNTSHSNWNEIVRYSGIGNGKTSQHLPGVLVNTLHQYYHLTKFENMSGKDIRDYDTIIEFGGGYGDQCLLINKIKPDINYHIIDLPELHQIQKFYLDGNNISNYKQISADELPENTGKTIFFSFWALSEVPWELRNKIFEWLCKNKISFFLSAQKHYCEYNNKNYFSELKLDGYKITIDPMIGPMNESFYVLGEAL